jgi:hypothetical protein
MSTRREHALTAGDVEVMHHQCQAALHEVTRLQQELQTLEVRRQQGVQPWMEHREQADRLAGRLQQSLTMLGAQLFDFCRCGGTVCFGLDASSDEAAGMLRAHSGDVRAARSGVRPRLLEMRKRALSSSAGHEVVEGPSGQAPMLVLRAGSERGFEDGPITEVQPNESDEVGMLVASDEFESARDGTSIGRAIDYRYSR